MSRIVVNRQLGIAKHIALNSQNNIFKIYVKFEHCKRGLMKMNTDNFARQHLWVPIEKNLLILRSNQIKTHSLKELSFH